ncbi:hypothetical protein KA005_52945 [bacterium]|nr:hypothetical protein [bacterium]
MRFKKALVYITLVCFIVCVQGCYTNREITRQQLDEKPEYRIHKVVTMDNEVYEFTDGGQFIDNMVIGYITDDEFVKIPIEQVRTIYIRNRQGGIGCFAVAALVGVIVGMIALNRSLESALSSSCPFIYSFDGTQYVLDGEPYGGAVCQGLQRTDFCRLDNLQPVDGEYRVLLANELNEIQYTDEFRLLIVDHSKDVVVYQDANGLFYTIGDIQKPLHIIDADGNDQYQLLSAEDYLLWDAGINNTELKTSSSLRDTLFITFPRPHHETKAKLIVNGCNTIWGSYMLKQMVSLYGNQVKTWYEEMLTPTWQQFIEEWNDQVELYQLQVYVQEDSGWMHRGEIMGGGPIVSETRVVPIDLTNVQGDTVIIRVTPPLGFWQFNMFAIDYSEDAPIEIQEVSPKAMTAHDGTDICDILESSDSDYYIMPETGQQALLVFSAPELQPDVERTIFAKVSGYYDLKIDTDEPPQYEKISRILSDPDYAVIFSNNEYAEKLSKYTSLQK